MDYSLGSNLLAGRHHDGNPSAGLKGSRVEAEFINLIGDELVGIVEAAGLAPDYSDRTQLLQSIRLLSQGLATVSFSTVAAAIASEGARLLDDGVAAIFVRGHTTEGMGGAGYRRARTEPTHEGKFVVEGQWWELDEFQPTPQMFGAAADGLADDTDAIQAAVNYAITTGAKEVLFPAGTYLVTSVDVRHGMTLRGAGAAVLRRPDNMSKWTRTFTTQNNLWNDAADSPPLRFENLNFDGNRVNQGAYTNYEKEQAHFIFLMADAASPGRLRVIVDGCVFDDGVADAISVYNNVDISISNCTARNVFRGGLTVTGGWTKVRATNCRFSGEVHPTGLDIEVDGPGFGDSLAVDVQISNMDIGGDFDFGIYEDGVGMATNITTHGAPFTVTGRGTISIMNSTFVVGVLSSKSNRIVYPQNTRFLNCTFIASKGRATGTQTVACGHVFWSIGAKAETDSRLVYEQCTFTTDGSIEPGDTVYGIATNADSARHDNRLVTRNCEFSASLTEGVHIARGGNWRSSGDTFDCPTACWTSFTSATYPMDIVIENPTYGKGVTSTHHIVTHGPDGTIRYRNTETDEEQNRLSTSYGIATNTYSGSRKILSVSPPTYAANKAGLPGDIWQLRRPVAGSVWQWVCTNGSVTDATWKPLTGVAI